MLSGRTVSLNRSLIRPLLWVSLLIYLVGGLSSAHGSVWCLSGEGTLRLESGAGSCCAGTVSGEVQQLASAAKPCCATCTDIPLSVTSLKARSQRPASNPSPSAGQTSIFRPLPSPLLLAGLAPPPPPSRPAPSLAHLRTVVLRH